MKRASPFVAGLVAGIALVVACGQSDSGAGGGVSSANASPDDCATWQFVGIPSDLPTAQVAIAGADGNQFTITATELPSGWEPFGMGTANYMKRCKP